MATKKRKEALKGDIVIDAGRAESPIDPVDPEISEEFREAQNLAGSGPRQLARKLQEHHSRTPELSGGDIDADWDRADTGEETVGGSNPTPDQNIVEELGKAVGITYNDDEPLHIDTADPVDRIPERRTRKRGGGGH